MIEHYSSGLMIIDGDEYRQDLKIIKGLVLEDWWRKEDHRLETEDLDDILLAHPDVLVIGTGYDGNMRLEETLRSTLEKRHIKVVAEKTSQAVETFNRLASESKDVAGEFHLTC